MVRISAAPVTGYKFTRPTKIPTMLVVRTFAAVVMAASVLLGLQGCSRVDEAALTTSARQHLERDDAGAAIIDAKSLLQAKPESAAGRFWLGRALLAAGDLVGAQTELERAQQFGHAPDQLWPAQAELLLAQNKPDELIASFEGKTLPDAGASAALHTALARAWKARGNTDRAEAELDAALQFAPQHADALILKARFEADAGNLAAAQVLAAALVKADEGNARAWILHADLLSAQQADPPAVEKAYRRAVELRPTLVGAQSGLIGWLLQQRRVDDAARQLEAMAKALPGNPTTAYYRAWVAFERGDHVAVRDITQRLLRVAGDQPAVLLLAGLADLQLGSLSQAEALLTKAHLADPGRPGPRQALAGLYVRQGQPQRALDLMKPLLQDRRAGADALTVAAQALALAGDFRKADELFAQASKQRPHDAGIHTAMAQSLLARGQLEPGIQHLQAASEADAKGLAADLQLVSVHVARGQFDQALKVVAGMERKQPDSAQPLQVHARVLQAQGNVAGARKAYEAALAKQPGYLPALSSLAALDMADRRFDAARKRYEDLLQADPRSVAALMALAVIERRSGGTREAAAQWVDKAAAANPQDASFWRQAIDFHRQDGDHPAALARARAALAAVPGNPELLTDVAAVQLAAGDVQQGIASLDRVAQLQPKSADAQIHLAQAHLQAGNAGRARTYVNQALALAPDSLPALRMAMRLAMDDQQAARALDLARAAQKRQPKAALGWQLEAELAARQKRWPEAVAVLRTALAREESTDLAMAMNMALGQAGLAEEQARFQQQWQKAHPRDARFIAHLGELAVLKGDLPAAEAQLRQAVKLRPDDPVLINNLAHVLAQRNNPEALALAQRALELAPYLSNVQDTLAFAYAQANDLSKAIAWQKRAVEQSPEQPQLQLTLARYLVKAGRKDDARDELQRLTGPDAPAALRDEAQALLRQAGG